MVPLLVAGHVRARGRVQGVDQVGDGVDLLAAHEPRLGHGRRRVHLQRRVAVPESGEGHRVLVARHEQPLVGGVVHRHLVVQVGVDPHLLQLQLAGHAALVNAHQLLVQVVEARPGRPQPVLEDGYVAHPPVGLVQALHRVDRQARVGTVLFHAQGSRAGQGGGVDGVVGEVASADDDVVAPGEEGRQEGVAGPLVHRVPGVRVRARGRQLGARHPLDVLDAGRLGQVCLHALAGGVGDLVAVVDVPVVEGEDLEEVGHPPELGYRVEQGGGGKSVETLEAAVGPAHDACLLRGCLQVAPRAEGAAVGAVGRLERADLGDRVRDGAVGAARHGPHLGAGEGADLLDRPVGQARKWFGGGCVRHEHVPIVTPCDAPARALRPLGCLRAVEAG